MSDTQHPVPQEGGSYIREKDGSLRRTEFTREPGEAEPAAEPKAEDAKAGEAETLVKRKGK